MTWGWASAQATLCYMGTQLPSPKMGRSPRSQFPAHFYCGQTAGCIKMPLGMDGDLPPAEKGRSREIFGPRLSWPNGWMDLDGTWHGGSRPQPRRLCVRWGPIPPLQKGGRAPFPNFRPISIVAKRLDLISSHLYLANEHR